MQKTVSCNIFRKYLFSHSRSSTSMAIKSSHNEINISDPIIIIYFIFVQAMCALPATNE